MATITLYDETTLGEKSPGLTLEILTQRITARELIRQRIDREAVSGIGTAFRFGTVVEWI